jgi:hypothetical protein
MSYPSGYEHVDPATGARYVWDGGNWVRQDNAQTPAPYGGYALPQPQQYPAPYQQVAGPAYVSDQSSKNVQAIIAWILTVFTFGYMLPWAIAATRGKSNAGMIGILNLLLGWTIIGWICALVMACGAHQIAATGPNVSVVTAVGVQNAYPYPPPNGYARPAPAPNGQAYQQPASEPHNPGLPYQTSTAPLPPAHES